MTPSDTLTRLRTILSDTFGIRVSLNSELGEDMIDHMRVLPTIDEEFDMAICRESASECATIRDLVDLIEGRWG